MPKTFQNIAYISILLVALFSSAACVFHFDQQGEFIILQLTDQHYCEHPYFDLATQNLTRNLLEWVQPDLIVFSGDAVSGYTPGSSADGFYYSCWLKWTEPLLEYGIPYAYVLGNHDAEGDLDREEIVRLDQTNPLSIRSECEGIPDKTTFHVPIYSGKDQSQLAANLWMFDSGNRGCGGYIDSWGCVDEDQLEWYDEVSKKLKDQHGEDVHHLAFSHIPIREYMYVYNNEKIYGNSDELISCPNKHSKFFDHILKNGDISALFLGHDHRNDFGGWYKGVELVYGRKSGYGSYGERRGGRVIKLQERFNKDGKLTVTRDHYIINENGTIEDTKILRQRQDDIQDDCTRPRLSFLLRNGIYIAYGIVTIVFGLVVKRAFSNKLSYFYSYLL